jgi:hypothetical protein
VVAQTVWPHTFPFIHGPTQMMKIASGDGQTDIPMIGDERQCFGIEGQHTIRGPIDFGEQLLSKRRYDRKF